MALLNIQEKLVEGFEKFNFNGTATLPFHQERIKALETFKSLGFPTTKNEDWKYSSLKKLGENEFNFGSLGNINKKELETHFKLDFEATKLTFVNGIFNKDLSDDISSIKGVKISSLENAINENSSLVQNHLGKYTDNKLDANNAANLALSKDGIVIEIEANRTLEIPLFLNIISDVKTENVGSFPRNIIIAGKNSEAKVVEVFSTVGDNAAFTNIVTEIVVEEDARLDYYKIQDDNDSSFHVGTTQVVQKSKSYFYASTITLNGGFVRNNLNLVLDGEHIDNHLYGLYIPNAKQHVDNHTIVDHQKPNCQSNELYKGVLMGSSTGVFNGKIFVREDAQKTNAYQNCKNVITSDNATMNSKPQLEIWADDVKCSHGTTTGKLNEDAIFYMQSRGIPKDEAVKLQLLAFASDIISQIKIDSLREQLEVLIENKLIQD